MVMERTRVTIVPHTHWDREWYEPFEGFLGRLVEMMDTLIDLLDHGFPHFHLDGQTALIDDYLEVRPEREPDIRRLAAEGRISVGPWFTQMDEFLTSGESHIRNLERGLARNRELGAQPVVGYLPDQFGHIGQMPQILVQGGLDRVVVWRGVPKAIGKTAFWWQAPDGTRVLTEYLAFGYSIGMNLRSAQQPGEMRDMLRKEVGNLAPMTARPGAMLIMAGQRPPRAGPDAADPPRGHDADRAGSGHRDRPGRRGSSTGRRRVTSRSGRASCGPARGRSCCPTSSRRGSTRSASAAGSRPWWNAWPSRSPRWWTGSSGRPGSSTASGSSCCGTAPTTRCAGARWTRSARPSTHVTRRRGSLPRASALRAAEHLGTQVREPGVLRWNPSPFERDGVPGLGWRVDPRPVRPEEQPVAVETRFGRFVVDGLEIGLFDETDVGDLYNFCPDENAAPIPPESLTVDGQAGRSPSSTGARSSSGHRASGDERFVRLEGAIDNARSDHRLRLVVTLPGPPVEGALAGAPFELVERGLMSEGGFEPDSPCWPARGVVLAGDVAALHEGVMEYEVVDGRALAITLLRCTGTISRGGFPTRNWPAGPDVATPEAQMKGRTEFALGLIAGARREDLLDAWERFALPLLEVPAVGGGELGATGTLFDLQANGARLSNVRRSRGAVEVRLWNPGSTPLEAVVGGQPVALGPARIETVPLQ